MSISVNSGSSTPIFSVIVPVYNRIDEVEGLLESLLYQKDIDPSEYEVIIVEDGSTQPCDALCEQYRWKGLDIRYFFKENEGRSIARNYGIERAKGEWLVFFDSDCIIPEDYFSKLKGEERLLNLDCYGGPDAAHPSFTPIQKAINFAMTSFLTTGGIRGGKNSMEKFTPRTFNMGFRRNVFDKVGGYREMYSEDIDMSTRIKQAGFRIGLLSDQKVFHKRRVDFKKFFRQVYVFGRSRITLQLLYPGSMKVVHWLPSLFVVGCIISIVLACLFSPWWLLPIGIYVISLFIVALCSTGSIEISLLSVLASFIQLSGYGTGFLSAYTTKILFNRGRNIEEEILARKGK